MSQRPRILSPEELAQWRANDARQQAAKDAKAEALKAEFGEKFERTAEVFGVEDAEVRILASDRMAVLLAERGSNPATMEHRDYMDVADQAIDFAYGEDARRMAAEIADGKATERTDGVKPESRSAEVAAPATSDRTVPTAPDRPAERDPPLPVEGNPPLPVEQEPAHQAAAPDQPPAELPAEPIVAQREQLLERQFGEYQAMRNGGDRNEARFEALAQRHEQELAAFEWQTGAAPEPDRSVSGDGRPEEPGRDSPAAGAPGRAREADPETHLSSAQGPFDLPEDIRRDAQWWNEIGPVREAERVPPGAANDVGEPPTGTAATPAAPEQAEPGSRRLRFYEDLKQEHATAVGRDDKADPKDKGGGKALNFYEDRQPPNAHNRDL